MPASMLQLPHTPGCIVCGPNNPHGMRLSLFVYPGNGTVYTEFTPRPADIGFEGVVHGGVLAAVLDEAMVWAATWAGRRFCLCGEMTVRYRFTAPAGRMLFCYAKVESSRSRLIRTSAYLDEPSGLRVAEATGKYVPLSPERNREFVATLIDDPATAEAARVLKGVAQPAG